MWKCPKCNRSFKHENQSHFCLEKPESIDEYISVQPEEIQGRLRELDSLLKELLPDAMRVISWGMPTYKGSKNIIHFASFKNHIGIYPGAEAMCVFSEKLSGFKTSKGAFRIPHNETLPIGLIEELAIWCRDNNV